MLLNVCLPVTTALLVDLLHSAHVRFIHYDVIM